MFPVGPLAPLGPELPWNKHMKVLASKDYFISAMKYDIRSDLRSVCMREKNWE